MPLFSIITATFDAESRIERTLQSVLAQDSNLFEYIIVDGGSTDRTMDVIKRYGDRVRWVSERDLGVYDAMNKGIDLSTGRYLYFIGAGDVIRPSVLARIAEALPAHDCGVVYGNFHLPDDETDYYGEVTKWFLLLIYNICHQSAFYGRDVFKLIGQYDLRYRVRADYAVNVEVFCDDRIEKKFVNLVIADYEGGGLSELNEDAAFVRDFPALARRCLKVNRLAAPDPFFSILMRIKFNAPLRNFGRRMFQVWAQVKRVIPGA